MHRDVALSLLGNGGVISLESTPSDRAAQPYHAIVESSSGSTVTSLRMIARQHNIARIRAWMSNQVSPTKSSLMRFFGLGLALFGGPWQSAPSDPMGGLAKAASQGAVGEMMECLRRSEREVLVVDHTGETARLAVSVLRQAGVKAFSVVGGWEALVGCAVEVVKA
ncbi:uncharacterized protein UDID_19098 [Ustilago sp. UG-2017a]|nr:uncharacterized protein UDID_19098 [Ustilago sp. UG-2017a]